MLVLTRDQVRALDRIAVERFSIPGIVLMENAGRGATDSLLERLDPPRDAPLLILSGRGNNGGDGFVIARHLHVRGFEVQVGLLGEIADFRGAGEAPTNFEIVEKLGLVLFPLGDEDRMGHEIGRAGVVVDAMLGTGLTGEVRGRARSVIAAVNESGCPVFAVDIPSGLDCDTGRPLGTAVRASATATFAAMKRGFVEPGAEAYTGPVDVVDLGAPPVYE